MGRRGRPPYPDILTPREWEVLALLREGLTNEAIAARLGVTHAAAKYHVSEILSKLGVATREEAAAWEPAPAEAGKPRLRRRGFGVAGWLRPVTVGKAALITAAVAVLAGLGVLAWSVLRGSGEEAAPVVVASPTASESAVTPLTSEAPAPTPISADRRVPWIRLPQGPSALDAASVLGPNELEAWVTIDPESGTFVKQPPIDGHVPGRLSGNRYSTASVAGSLIVLDATERRSIWSGAGWEGEVSPDGRWIAIIPGVEGSTLEVADSQSGARIDLGDLGKPVQVAWSGDDRLAIVKAETLYVAEPPGWKPRTIGAFPFTRPVWSPDGRLTYADSAGIHVASADFAEVDTIPSSPELPSPVGMSWSTRGQLAASPVGSGVYVVSQVGVAQPTWASSPIRKWGFYWVSPFGAGDGAVIPTWSPDGSAMAFVGSDAERGVNGIIVAMADGQGAHQLTAGAGVEVIGWTEEGILARVFRGL